MTFANRTRIGTMRRETLADRENQLTLLHQEILLRREALLHTTGSYIRHSARSTASTGSMNPADASIRNARLLKDIENLEQDIHEELNSVPSPRFITLQNNYWSMVRSLLPLWEESLSGASSASSRKQQKQQQQQHQQQQQQQQQQQGLQEQQKGKKSSAKSSLLGRKTK